MQKRGFVVFIFVVVALLIPLSASAVGLDIDGFGGVGIALGTSAQSGSTGSPRVAADGGVDLDLFLLSVGPVNLGLSTGLEYSYLSYHSTSPVSSVSTLTTDATYKYLNIPLAVVARFMPSDALGVTVRAGTFFGYFLGGSSDLSYNPQIPLYDLVNGSQTFDSSNTSQWEYGLHLSGGVDMKLIGPLFLSPAVIFDAGLSNSTNSPSYPYKTTFWGLTANVGIKYVLF